MSAIIINPRLNSLATNGLLAGDGSMSARIFHMLAPMWSWKHDLPHFMFGWGAGNISNAVRTGYAGARQWYDAHGGAPNTEIDGLANPPADTFTMSIYASFITEFGLFCFLAFLLLVLAHVASIMDGADGTYAGSFFSHTYIFSMNHTHSMQFHCSYGAVCTIMNRGKNNINSL